MESSAGGRDRAATISELESGAVDAVTDVLVPPSSALETSLADLGVAPALRRRKRFVVRGYRTFVIVLAVLAMELVYVFLISAGTFRYFPTYNANYDLLAEGFRAGHLHLSVAPSPELLAKPDPFDPVNRPLWFWDISLYKGQYYLYWGPLPALGLAMFKGLFGVHSQIGDQYPLFAFYTIYLVAGALLIDRMARRAFPGLPLYWVLMAIAVFAFVTPTPFLLATAGIYQAAIAGGQAFLFLGLVFAFDALWGSNVGRPSRIRLLAAGAAWAAAIACRVSVGPPIMLVFLITLALERRARRRWLQIAGDAFWMGAPVALGVFGLLLYNKLRFDAWLEFGTSHQLSTMRFRTSWSYLVANAYSYFLRPVLTSCTFPYIVAPWDPGPRAFPKGFHLAEGYESAEPVAGLLLVAPWIWLVPMALVAVFLVIRSALASGTRPDGAKTASLWCATTFAICGTVTFLPVAALFIPTMRYLGDVSGGIVLFATWGAWCADRALRRRRIARGFYTVVVSLLACSTVIMGLLLGFEGYNGQFRLHNPALHDRIVHLMPACAR